MSPLRGAVWPAAIRDDAGEVAPICIPGATGPVIWEEHAFAPEEDFATQSPEVRSPTEPHGAPRSHGCQRWI